MTTAADLVGSKPNVLVDFDGPICAVFGGLPAPEVARRLRETLGLTEEHSGEVRDPFDILRLAAAEGRQESLAAERALTRLELEAVDTATPTAGAADVLAELARSGHSIAVVSNNSAAAVKAYLTKHNLADTIATVAARVDAAQQLLKPDPHLLKLAMLKLGASASSCVMVGDSVADIEAAGAADVPVIAYANRPGKRDRFVSLRPAATIDRMAELLSDHL